MKKYQTHTNENLAVIQWNEAFEYTDVYDALEEVTRKVMAAVPLLVIDHSTEFEASSRELELMVNALEKYKGHFTNRVAYVVAKDLHYGLGHILHIFCKQIGIDFFPFRNMGEAREWLSEIQPGLKIL